MSQLPPLKYLGRIMHFWIFWERWFRTSARYLR